MQKILVWDWPVRIGHWLIALAFIVAYATGDSETWRMVHVIAGGALAGLALFRLVWGFVGSRHARFASFVATPGAAWRYLVSVSSGQPQHHAGHNPAGGYAILALLLLGMGAAISGWPLYQDMGGEVLEELHEGIVNLMLMVVLLHLAGVVVGSLVHRENLPRAMLTGYKLGRTESAIASARAWAIPLLLACAGLVAWGMSL